MRISDFKVIFQDVDGCLNPADGEDFGVTSDWEPSSQQIEMFQAIDRAVEAAPLEHFVINTGRFWPIFSNIAKHFSTSKMRYFLMEHACVIYDRELGKNLDLETMASNCGLPELAARYASLESMQNLLHWYDAHGRRAMEDRYETAMPRLDKAANLSFAIPDGVDGAELLSAIAARAQEDFEDQEFQQFEFCRSDRFIDILPGIHKLDGIALLCAHLGIEQRQALAVGDYLNDLAVFESFGQVMCPANAHPRIRDLTEAKGASGHVSKHSFGASLLDFLESPERSD